MEDERWSKVPPRTEVDSLCPVLAEVLRGQREAHGLSMYALAKKAGISREMVSRIEAGRAVPSIDLVLRICRALRMPLTVLSAAAEGQWLNRK